jgi:DNA-binding LacI/PurR family transcriptional regulator
MNTRSIQEPAELNGSSTLPDQILQYVREHSLKPGARVPSEREFQRIWSVPRPAVSRAIANLLAKGYLRRQGYKLTVAPHSEAPAAPVIHVLHPHHSSQESAFIREQLIEAAHDVATAFHTHVIPILANTAIQQSQQLAALLKTGTHGFILWPLPGTKVTHLLEQFTAAGVPFITCDLDFGYPYFVGTDNEAGMGLAIDHLHDLGHRRLAYVTQSLEIVSLQHRRDGYVGRCQARGLDESAAAIIEVSSVSVEAARQAWNRLRKNHPSATAVCCSNDLLALRLMECARDAGVDVPAQLSVVGFDDIEPASFATPPLTTVAQDFYEIGVLAAHTLYQRLRAGQSRRPLRPIRIRLEPYLIQRDSTASVDLTAALDNDGKPRRVKSRRSRQKTSGAHAKQ